MTHNEHGTIGVITSDPQVSYLLERILKPAGYAVFSESSPAQALQVAEVRPPDLVIVGHPLGDGSGLDLACALIDRFPGLPAILFTDQLSNDLLLACLRASICEVISPPLRAEQILTAVASGLERLRRQKGSTELVPKRYADGLERRVDELETLSTLGRSITASLDLDGVLAKVVEAAVGLTGAEEGSLLLLDETNGELYMRASRNFQEDFVRTFRVPVADSLAGSVIRTGQPVIVGTNDPVKVKTSYLVTSLMYVPLQTGGRVVGVLGVDNRLSTLAFTEYHLKALQAMADYAVIAIENAQLYAHTSVERNQLETILTRVQDGVIILDSQGRVLLVNQTVRDLFGLGEAYLTGKLLGDVISQEDLLELIRADGRRALNRSEICLEDGRVFSAQLTPIADVGLVVTLHDITSLKKLDRIKSEFVTTVSHDLRSPLTSILGYVDLLGRVGPLTLQQADFAGRIQASVQTITALVNDLLNLGRIEAGFDTLKETLPLNPVIQSAVDSIKGRMGEKGLQLILELPPAPLVVFGNAIQLRQMLDNLLDNAVKYTPAGGILKVRLVLEEKQVILQVIDTGQGIPITDLPYVFDKFYRASNAADGIPGTGLGLSIVRSIVENHHGRVWVESTLGQGSTFTAILPPAEK